MKNCTGIRCVMQNGTVDPANCACVSNCPHATPPKTHADRIRAMTDEELAEVVNDLFYGLHEKPGMCDVCDHDSIQNCKQCWLEWLSLEAEP